MSRYSNTKIKYSKVDRKNRKRIHRSYGTTVYSTIPVRNDDMFIIATEGDRLDNLAFQFYGNTNLWWYIAKANNINTMNIEAGTSLRIPISADYAIGE